MPDSSDSTATGGRWPVMAGLAIWLMGALVATGCRPDMEVPAPGIDPATAPRDGTAGETRDGGDARDGVAGQNSGDAPGDAGGDAGDPADGGDDGGGVEVTGDDAPMDTAPVLDVAVMDSPPPPDLAPDLPVLPSGRGGQAPDVSGITNLDALTIARDGTIYFAQAGTPSGWIGRLRPGAAPELRWVSVPEGAMLWGLTTDDSRQRLYVASASGHLIQFVALGGNQPSLQVLTREVDEPDDLAVGPGGEIYFADSDNHLYRVSPGGELNRVTTRTFGTNQATGLAFTTDGSLLVGTMAGGPVYKLGVASGTEQQRAPLELSADSPD